MTKLTALADRIDQTFDLMIDELEKILMAKVKDLSKSYPTRTFRMISGHGSLMLEVSRRGSGWNFLTGGDDHYTVDCRGDGNRAPQGFASDLFKQITIPCQITFLKLASYDGVKTTGTVKQLIGINQELKDTEKSKQKYMELIIHLLLKYMN